ncbi:MAG: helix-turn-helix domain-containing protein [Lactobacillales bacterium]|jgi:transcriptional regulator with XRE-family HTH domain|nr:helix-turn-helix domain-containing protein [Lactobacillales bacterium]
MALDNFKYSTGVGFKRLRTAYKLSQEDAGADVLGPTTMSKFENGKVDIKLSQFFQLMDNIGSSPREFFGQTSASRANAFFTEIKRIIDEADLVGVDALRSEIAEVFVHNEHLLSLYLAVADVVLTDYKIIESSSYDDSVGVINSHLADLGLGTTLDFAIIVNCSYVIDEQILRDIFADFKANFFGKKNYVIYDRLTLGVCFSILCRMIDDGHYTDALRLIDEFSDEFGIDHVNFKVDFLSSKALILLMQGRMAEANQLIASINMGIVILLPLDAQRAISEMFFQAREKIKNDELIILKEWRNLFIPE